MTGNYSEPADKDVRIANDIIYNNQGCPEDFKCAGKITPLDFNASGTYNGHIWDCNQTFETINMISICYMPMQATFCQPGPIPESGYQGTCTKEGIVWDEIKNDWLYCSFGKDDERIPPYPGPPTPELGGCCVAGEFAEVSGEPATVRCYDSDECGFLPGSKCDFNWSSQSSHPKELYQREYFAKEGCIDWETDESCCWHIHKYGGFGNYPCDIFDMQ